MWWSALRIFFFINTVEMHRLLPEYEQWCVIMQVPGAGTTSAFSECIKHKPYAISNGIEFVFFTIAQFIKKFTTWLLVYCYICKLAGWAHDLPWFVGSCVFVDHLYKEYNNIIYHYWLFFSIFIFEKYSTQARVHCNVQLYKIIQVYNCLKVCIKTNWI